jgi:DNA-binding response OmpR family regulator
MKRILIVEDDPAILRGLEAALAGEHFEVSSASDGERGYDMARKMNVDLIILDLMLPTKDGTEICRDLRKNGVETPILILTSKKEETDKVVGLELGADDYMTKPFSIRELIARVRAILRRRGGFNKEIDTYAFGAAEIDFKKQESTLGGHTVQLSAREYAVLKYLILHEGEVITRDMLLNDVWGYDTFPTTRTVDNYILSLRKKLEVRDDAPKHFLTVHTVGYKFVIDPS